MTLPVAAAMMFAKSFKQLIFLSILFGELAVIIGLISGYYLSIPPGGTIVITAIIIFLLSICLMHFKFFLIRVSILLKLKITDCLLNDNTYLTPISEAY